MLRTYPEIPPDLPAPTRPTRPISFVCVRYCDEFLHNIKASACVNDPLNQFVVVDNQRNLRFDTLGAAINAGLLRAIHDLVVVVHEDVVLPDGWQSQFEASLAALEAVDPDWGLLGSVGWVRGTLMTGHYCDPYQHFDRMEGDAFKVVERLDEQLLVLDRRRLPSLDPRLPSIHMIGRDLANRARAEGQGVYVIDAPTIHKFKDAAGNLIQRMDDSEKIRQRSDLTYVADRLGSHRFLARKWGQEMIPVPKAPEPLPRLDDPGAIAGLGGPIVFVDPAAMGDALMAALARDCGVFTGSPDTDEAEAPAGDAMALSVYHALFARLRHPDAGLFADAVDDLRQAAGHLLRGRPTPGPWGIVIPEAGLILPDIAAAFPKARYVVIERDPEHGVLRQPVRGATIDTQLGQGIVAGAYDHFGLPRDKIMVDCALERAAVVSQFYQSLREAHLGGLSRARRLSLQYDAVLADPEAALQAVAAWLGGPATGRSVLPAAQREATRPAPKREKHTDAALALDRVHRLQRELNHRAGLAEAEPVIVLGMHRSGTSCLAGCLEQAGLFLGATSRWNPHNTKGNRENRITWRINNAVLEAHGAAWDKPPDMAAPLQWPNAQKGARDAFLAGFPAGRRWGLKDPRINLLLDGWRAALPKARFIGSFRHPDAVAASLARRGTHSLDEARALWLAYNRRVLALHDEAPFPLIDFDQEPEAYKASVAAACETLGLRVPDSGFDFFEDGLRSNRTARTIPDDPEIAGVYADLLRRASDGGPARRTGLSIVVIFHDMRREAARTLHSLSAAYQSGVSTDDYEVIAIDNGSRAPLDAAEVAAFGPNFRYYRHDTASVSPAGAMNWGASLARHPMVAFITDGARMASPGLVRKTLAARDRADHPMVFSLSWHLGPKPQHLSAAEGYDQRAEDALLEGIAWPENGYRLFEISTLAPSSREGFLGGVPPELSWIAVSRAMFDAVGGFDERFQSPGGGFLGFEFRDRLLAHPWVSPVHVLGEGVFHQFHGGVTSNAPQGPRPQVGFREEYQALLGREIVFEWHRDVVQFGTLCPLSRRFVQPLDDASGAAPSAAVPRAAR